MADLAELHAMVLRDLDDRAARLVYADALIEAGDPRGELIALQLDPARGRETSRERRLLREHWATWLGPLAALLDRWRTRFAGGFLHHAALHHAVRAVPSEALAVATWDTVEALDAGHVLDAGLALAPVVARIAAAGRLRAMWLPPHALPAVVRALGPRHALRTLGIAGQVRSALELAGALDAFPALTRLELRRCRMSDDDLVQVAARLGTDAVLACRWRRADPTQLAPALARAVGKLRALELELDDARLRLTAVERSLAVELAAPATAPSVRALIAALAPIDVRISGSA